MPPHTFFEIQSLFSFAAEHDACKVQPPKSPLTPKKSVTFNEKVRAKKTIHFADYSDEEIRVCWYDDCDYRRIKNDVKFEASLLENDCLDDDDSSKYCSRGLSHLTTKGAKQRSANKRRGLALVLEEQNLQQEEGSNDPEYIAEIYASSTASCQAVARRVAEQDFL